MLIYEKSIDACFRACIHYLEGIYGSPEADAMAGWLFEDLFHIKRAMLRLQERNLTTAELRKLNKQLRRLLAHEPIQQVLGYAFFRTLKLKVNRYTLIPRPETEELVGHALELSSSFSKPPVMIDIGTGSGCIAIALKHEMPKASVFALDVSKRALQVARTNAAIYFADVHFINGNFLSGKVMESLPMVDIIVSNPPYITKTEWKDLDIHVRDFEPLKALIVPDDDALIYYKKLAEYARKQNEVWLFAEVHETYAAATATLMEHMGGMHTVLINDMQQKPRIVKTFFRK